MTNYGLDGVGIEPFVAGNGEPMESVRKSDVLAFLDNAKACLVQSADEALGREIGEKHSDGNSHLRGVLGAGFFPYHHQVGIDGVLDVFQGFRASSALGYAAGERRAFDMIAVFAFMDDDLVSQAHAFRITEAANEFNGNLPLAAPVAPLRLIGNQGRGSRRKCSRA